MKKITSIILLLVSLSLILGSVGTEKVLVEVFGLLAALVSISLIYFKKKYLIKPPYFLLYLVFLSFLGIYVVISPETFYSVSFFTLYLSSGAFYLLSVNKKRELETKLPIIIVGLGILMGVVHFINKFYFGNQIVPWSLYAISNGYKNHNHIADLWALVLLVTSYWGIKKKKSLYFLFFVPGIYFFAISLSRSAYLSLIVGLLVFVISKGIKVGKKVFIPIFALALFFFVYAGIFKTTLYSRPYFFQAIAGFLEKPFGVGIGNFGSVSQNPQFHIFGMDGFAGVVHNIALEFISGMGVFGFLFLVFFGLVLYQAWKVKDKVLGKALLFALTANLLFDSTYFIATMVWLWFMFAGVILGKNAKTD